MRIWDYGGMRERKSVWVEDRSDGAGGRSSIFVPADGYMSGGRRLAVSCCDGWEISSEKHVDSNDSLQAAHKGVWVDTASKSSKHIPSQIILIKWQNKWWDHRDKNHSSASWCHSHQNIQKAAKGSFRSSWRRRFIISWTQQAERKAAKKWNICRRNIRFQGAKQGFSILLS